jgi:ERCC4-type nuclease
MATASCPANQALLDAIEQLALCDARGKALGSEPQARAAACVERFPVPLLPEDVAKLDVPKAVSSSLHKLMLSLAADHGGGRPGKRPRSPVTTPPLKLHGESAAKRQAPRAGMLGHPDLWSIERWQLVLLVDSREVHTRTDREFLESRLRERGVRVQVMQLALGDFVWGVHPEGIPDAVLVTDFIAERKRASDLAASIMDGRYEEQKRRLLSCPSRRPMYIVEGPLSSQSQLPADTLRSAIRSTRVAHGFSVFQTSSIDETIALLGSFHDSLARQLHAMSSSDLRASGWLPQDGIPLSEFQALSKKQQPMSVLSATGLMLRCVPQFSAARTETVLAFAPTPRRLFEAVSDDSDEAVATLAALPAARQRRTLGVTCAGMLVKALTTIVELIDE